MKSLKQAGRLRIKRHRTGQDSFLSTFLLHALGLFAFFQWAGACARCLKSPAVLVQFSCSARQGGWIRFITRSYVLGRCIYSERYIAAKGVRRRDRKSVAASAALLFLSAFSVSNARALNGR